METTIQPLRRFGAITSFAKRRFVFSLAWRLYAGFAIVLALLVLLVALGWVQAGGLAARIESLVDEDQRSSELVSELQIDVSDMVVALSHLCLVEDPQDIEYELKRLSDSKSGYGRARAALDGLLQKKSNSPEGMKQLAALKDVESDAGRLFDEAGKLAKGNGSRQAISDFVVSQTAGAQQHWVQALEDLKRGVVASTQASARQSRQSATAMRHAMAGIGLVALVIGAGAAFLITRSVTLPVGQAVAFARRIEAGDLTSALPATRGDEIGLLLRALNTMQGALNAMVSEIRGCADSIKVASSEVAAGNHDLSRRTEVAAGNLQMTSASMQQLTAVVQAGAGSATQASRMASDASHAAESGGAAVEQVVGSMAEISASSRKVADIIGVIDDIAFQTNILSLNAAVEAARAGEQGRGFAVVATEVRNLAQRASVSAGEIRVLIGASVETVESAARRVTHAGAAIHGIVADVKNVATVIGEVTAAARHQGDRILEVTASLQQLDTMTQQNAALVEQSAAAAESLRQQSERLDGLVASFQLR